MTKRYVDGMMEILDYYHANFKLQNISCLLKGAYVKSRVRDPRRFWTNISSIKRTGGTLYYMNPDHPEKVSLPLVRHRLRYLLE
jgi:hypothetical protein